MRQVSVKWEIIETVAAAIGIGRLRARLFRFEAMNLARGAKASTAQQIDHLIAYQFSFETGQESETMRPQFRKRFRHCITLRMDLRLVDEDQGRVVQYF